MYFLVMATIQEVYNSDWPKGLAAAAYFMIQSQDPQILDKHEPVPEKQEALELGIKIKELSSDPRMIESLNLLITEVAVAYVVERTTSRTNMGGPYTLFGHANDGIIELGFIALICSSIDSFKAFTIFKEYNALDKKIIKAINTMNMDSAPADMEARRLKWIALEEECDALREEAGL
jgi:hypothetical protein